MRWKQKIPIVCLLCGILFISTYRTFFGNSYNNWSNLTKRDLLESPCHTCNPCIDNSVKPLTCFIFGNKSPGCYYLNDSTVAVDFKHLNYWYETEGTLDRENRAFYWSNKGAPKKIHLNNNAHNPFGDYMGLSYDSDPESKSYILLVDAKHNIPISRQWDPKGYPYPIQISQYGFAYHSRYLRLQKLRVNQLLTQDDTLLVDLKMKFSQTRDMSKNWACDTGYRTCYLGWVADSVSYEFNSATLDSKLSNVLIIGSNWKPGTRFIITVISTPSSLQSQFQIQFACSNVFGEGRVLTSNDYWSLGYTETIDLKVVLFVGSCKNVVIAQNFAMVLKKAVYAAIQERVDIYQRHLIHLRETVISDNFTVKAVELWVPESRGLGNGSVREMFLFAPIDLESQVTPSRKLHLANTLFAKVRFMAAADWLAQNQSNDGSWKIPVKRVFTREIFLKPGWCSAMGQGQGISLLVRAYNITGDRRYLSAAEQALEPFSRLVHDPHRCGVRTNFLEQVGLPWYEEYPVLPGVFVLNGFVFALVGLFDLTQTKLLASRYNHSIPWKSFQLLEEGINTLVNVLPLYDSGMGSFYDLRHLHLAHSYRLSPRIDRLNWDDGEQKGRLQTLRSLLKAGPNRARWKYHLVHVAQLHQLSKVIAPQHAQLWDMYFDRWIAYAWGFRSGHN